MDIDDYLNNPDRQKIYIKESVALLRTLEKSVQNQNLLVSILKRQLEIEETLKGKVESDFDESVREKLNLCLTDVFERSDKEYMKLVSKLIDGH
tara:strand:- start:204 stop:485 length:282 start_codon:yes stop_codon:yes gene_type:complete